MTIIAIGAHPDDPEDGCGGTIARLTRPDQNPVIKEKAIFVYLTSGGAGIKNKSPIDAANIREKEAKKACEILHTEPLFLRLNDGNAFPTVEVVEILKNLFIKERPRVIFTHWPLDTHPDHRATFYIVIEAFSKVYGGSFASKITDLFDLYGKDGLSEKESPALLFWQTMPWAQSLQFYPHYFVDIDDSMEFKVEALESHASQNEGGHLIKWAEKVAMDLGNRCGKSIGFAEGFIPMRPPLN